MFIILALPALPPHADHRQVVQFAVESIGTGQCLTGLSGIAERREWAVDEVPSCMTKHPIDKGVSRREFITSAAGITHPPVPAPRPHPSVDVSVQALTPARGPLK
ncbi:hypothetical protein AB0H17_17965 [Streptomyces olivoreticuli]